MTETTRRFADELNRSLALLSVLVLLCLSYIARAQQSAPDNSQADIHRIHILRISEPIKIDARLDEAAWSQAEAATDFRQETPTEGAPASEKTEVRVLYDDKNIYLGIRAFDSEAKKINARELVRDASFSNDDLIEVLLDTYHDQRNAFRFAVNPLGTQQDALITDEGKDINLSWDGAWISAGQIDASGYVVEIAIPLTTLRFREGIESWGLNVARTIRRKNEQNLWSSWQREYGLERVSQAGELAGVEDIKRRRLYEIKPYATGGWRQGVPVVGAPGFDAGANVKAGLEVAKIGLTPSLTAEFTANPDFGQAEVDNQVINLTASQSSYLRIVSIELRRATFSDQCATALHLPPQQRFLHHLQPEYWRRIRTPFLQLAIQTDARFHFLRGRKTELKPAKVLALGG